MCSKSFCDLQFILLSPYRIVIPLSFGCVDTNNRNGYLLLLQFIQKIGSNSFKQNHDTIGVKFLILASSLILELRRTTERVAEYGNKPRTNIGSAFPGVVDDWSFIDDISKKLVDKFLYLLVLFLITIPMIYGVEIHLSVYDP